MKSKGIFVVFEGIDGSGKSSVCKRISEMLSADGVKNVLTAEPTRDEIGMVLRDGKVKGISEETEALLFVADRAQHTIKIKEWMSDGYVVICDRYYASTLAYQAAPLNGKALDMKWLKTLNEKVTIEPDATFLMDIRPEEGLKRISVRGETSKFERLEYLKAVRTNYLKIAKDKGFTVVNAERGIDEIVDEVYRSLRKRMEGKNAPV